MATHLLPVIKRVSRTLLRLTLLLTFLSLLKALWIEHYASSTEVDHLKRRQYLIHQLVSGIDSADMPSSLPDSFKAEWMIGTLSMTSAALVNIALAHPETRAESLKVVGMMIDRMLKADIRNYEIHYWAEDALESLNGSNGHIGYLGHLNFMIGAYRYLGGDQRYSRLGREISRTLLRRLQKSNSGYLETFPGYIFVPDNMVVYASLALADSISSKKLKQVVQRWQHHTNKHLLDADTGLLCSWLDADGTGIGPARGSYIGWNSFYLHFFAPRFAARQFRAMRKHFVANLPFNANGLLEYARGTSGPADIDSGPVIFGLSTSGTGFAVAAAKHAGDQRLYRGLLRTAEAAGFSLDSSHGRHYLLAPLVGDAIMLAMKTARIWTRDFVRE